MKMAALSLSGWRCQLVHSRILACAALGLALTSAPAAPARIVVEPFPLSQVQLLDSPFKEAMERNAEYLLSLEPDRLLHNTRLYCGLEPKGEIYGGWESQGIAGHSLGHYLTAISHQYAATDDERFRERIDYTIAQMGECQKRYGDGYIGALPPGELETMRAFERGVVEPVSGFNFQGGAWVPWYTQHKVLAGLVDAWTLGGNAQAKQVATNLANWVDKITRNLTPEQQQRMLRVEHGGMLDVLVQLYALTGEERYLATSKRFYDHAVFDPLLAGRDELNGKHANTQIPKIIGEACAYEVTGDENDRRISEFFWETVVNRRSWVIGGNSDYEHFFPVGTAVEHLSPATAESCNTYNMLKLTKHLFGWNPSVELGDYYERALYNHILASQEPERGMFAYFISLKPGLLKTYSTPFNSFWCCVGSGMENHTKYGEAIYFHSDSTLYVNLFIPSRLTWKEKGLLLEQQNDYPRENFTEFTIQSAPVSPIALQIRCPAWATDAPSFSLNGKVLSVQAEPGGFAEVSRVWKKGDRLRVAIPMGLHVEPLEGRMNKEAILYGPMVLAADLGPAPRTDTFPYARDQGANFRAAAADVPVLVCGGNSTLLASIKPLPDQPLTFRTEGVGKPADVTLRPFVDLPYEYYNVYWDVFSEPEWSARQAEMKAAEERRKREEARVVDELRTGEQQSEVDHQLTGERTETGDFGERKWRHARDGGFFEFRMKVLSETPQVLRCTYWGSDAGGRVFDILVDGQRLATQTLDNNQPGKFFNVDYPIPTEWLDGRETITVRFQAHPGQMAGGLYYCAVLKAEQAP